MPRYLILLITTICALFIAIAPAVAEEADEEDRSVRIEQWLQLGPFVVPLPAYGDEGEAKMGGKDVLKYEHIDITRLHPTGGSKVELIGGAAEWRPLNVSAESVALDGGDDDRARITYLATYIEVPRWMKVEVKATATTPFEITIDGESVVKNDKGGKMDDDAKSGTAELEMGKHLIIVKTVHVVTSDNDDADSQEGGEDDEAEATEDAGWQLDIRVAPGEDFDDEPMLSLSPIRNLNIHDVVDGPSVSAVHVSPDGELVAVAIGTRTPPKGTREGRVEIRRIKNNELVRTFSDMSGASSWQWAPSGHKLSYVATKDGEARLRVIDVDNGSIETVLDGVKDFQGYQWAPDASYIAYTVQEKPEKNESGVKRMRGAYDKRHYERNKNSLYLTSVPGGMTQRVTAGDYSVYLLDIHPDGKTMLISRSYEDLNERPFRNTEMVLLNLEDQSTKLLEENAWINSGSFSPDGKKILVRGGPSSFGDTGVNVPEGVIPNEYDGQAFIYDVATGQVDAITKDFDPAIQSAYWPKGNNIYFLAQETEFTRWYRYDVRKASFTRIDVDGDMIHRRDVARDNAVAVFTSSSANRQAILYSADLAKGKVKEMFDPAAARFADIALGEVEDYNVTMDNGDVIVGRVYLPPNFSEDRQWPCIVYYYGGTSPVGRSFGGRYPKNLWAANGYVVYVLQPSGATGFGQAFSSRHVNDWGKVTADEVIDGTKQFLSDHKYVDAERVGCIGASYGGFMTQLLVTKTDIFASAVSHAGISSITSYWGEGYWGYGYNSISAANSYPWNRRDIYVDQSPLYNADKVNTPLLLLHGTADTNVPPGESEQMYTALKILGKEVEYIRVIGENHWIVDYEKRIVWSNAIVSWFDKQLKDQPQWWDDQYPPLNDDDSEEARSADSARKR